MLGEAYLHHGAFGAAEAALIQSNRFFGGNNQLAMRYLAAAQLGLGKSAEAAQTLVRAQALLPERPISFEAETMAFYSIDGGGEVFIPLWQDLSQLQAEAQQP